MMKNIPYVKKYGIVEATGERILLNPIKTRYIGGMSPNRRERNKLRKESRIKLGKMIITKFGKSSVKYVTRLQIVPAVRKYCIESNGNVISKLISPSKTIIHYEYRK